MSETQLDNRDTLILERFECKHGGDRAVDLSAEFGTEVIEGVWIDSSNVVSVMHDSVTKVGPMAISGLQNQIIDWESVESDEGEELLKLYSEESTTHVAIEYVNMVCELFEVDQDTFLENITMREPQDDWPVLYDDPDTNLVAVVAPYIIS